MRIALASFLSAVTPIAVRGQEVPRLTVEQYNLPNGLEVILSEDHTTPVVAVSTYYRVGSADEPIGHTGVAHLVEHIMFAGSEHIPAAHFDEWLAVASASNVSSGSAGSAEEDLTRFDEWMPAGALPLALRLDADRMTRVLPTVDQGTLDRQRVVVENERRQRVDSVPYGRAHQTLRAALFPPGHPYSWSIFGSPEDVDAASPRDVRAFARTHYTPNLATLVVAGDFRPDSAKRWVARLFADIPRSPTVPTRPRVASFTLGRDSAVLLEDRVELPRVCYGWHSVKAFHPDDAALGTLAYILGGDTESRLYIRLVRDRQIAQAVAATQHGWRLDGLFTVEVTASPGVGPPHIDSLVARELAAVIDSGITERELLHARLVRRAQLLDATADVPSRADALNFYNYFVGTPDYAGDDVARYDRLTPDDIRRVAAKYLGGHKVILTVVPPGRAAPRIRTPPS